MRGFGVKLLVFGIGFLAGIGSSMLTHRTKVPQPPAIPTAIAVDQLVPNKGYDFLSQPRITAEWKPDATIEKTPCRNPKILPIWNAIRRDKELREDLDTEQTDCAGIFELKNVDLNQDGKMEILVRGLAPPMCGGTGNCRFWVFEKKGGSFRILLSSSDDADRTEIGHQLGESKQTATSICC